MHKSKNIVHINTKAKRSQASCFQEVCPFYSLRSVKDGSITSPAIPCNYNAILQFLPKKAYLFILRNYVIRVFDTLFAP